MKSFSLTLCALGFLTACTPTPSPKQYAEGQLFCSYADVGGPMVAAIANIVGVPVLVTGLASSTVSDFCKAWNAAAQPVMPPAVAVPSVAVAAIPPKSS